MDAHNQPAIDIRNYFLSFFDITIHNCLVSKMASVKLKPYRIVDRR